MRLPRNFIVAAFIIPPLALVLMISAQLVSAAGPYWGRALGVGYFSGTYHQNWCSVHRSGCTPGRTWSYTLPIINSWNAIPFNMVGTCGGADVSCVNALVSLLQDANASNDGRRHASSAFIVNLLLGRNAPGANTRDVSAADWADVLARLQSAQRRGMIGWDDSTSSSTNESYSQYINGSSEGGDVAWAGANHFTHAIVIYSDSSHTSTLFTMYRTCSNVRGTSGGIPPADYTLSPIISANTSLAESGSQVQVTDTMRNTGTAASSGTQWQLSQFVVPTGGSYPGAGNSLSAPAQYYGNNLVRLDGGTGGSYGAGDTPLGQPTETLPDYPAGYKICYALSVQPRSNSDAQWAHSAPVCVTISVKPLVQIRGSDLSVGNAFLGTTAAIPTANVDTSVTTKTISGTTYSFGSWVEYGIFATGFITNTGSAAAYAGTGAQTGLQNATLCSETQLSFNNAVTSGGVCSSGGSFKTVGNFTSSRSIPDVASNYPVTSSTPQFGGSNLSAVTTQGLYTSSSDLTLTGGTIGAPSGQAGAGRWIVINAPNATVTITGNITYTSGTLTSVNDIPQLIIIAKDINITDTVTQIDAWLIAKPSPTLTDGVINTCSIVAPSAPLSTTICSNGLTVNGPVMANHLLLRRTTSPGTGLGSGQPAEIFNLRPDAYMWAAVHTPSNGRIETVYSSELPPRL